MPVNALYADADVYFFDDLHSASQIVSAIVLNADMFVGVLFSGDLRSAPGDQVC